ncbi:hypothetical protein FHW02_003925 [Ochrobactrum sp. RH1CCR137]|nr:hypothetical protein [Ochrobactrum sp. RH1CCR137]MBA8857560.1 hypothetical protein [Ochrobactrum sp. RH1CCR134]
MPQIGLEEGLAANSVYWLNVHRPQGVGMC